MLISINKHVFSQDLDKQTIFIIDVYHSESKFYWRFNIYIRPYKNPIRSYVNQFNDPLDPIFLDIPLKMVQTLECGPNKILISHPKIIINHKVWIEYTFWFRMNDFTITIFWEEKNEWWYLDGDVERTRVSIKINKKKRETWNSTITF